MNKTTVLIGVGLFLAACAGLLLASLVPQSLMSGPRPPVAGAPNGGPNSLFSNAGAQMSGFPAQGGYLQSGNMAPNAGPLNSNPAYAGMASPPSVGGSKAGFANLFRAANEQSNAAPGEMQSEGSAPPNMKAGDQKFFGLSNFLRASSENQTTEQQNTDQPAETQSTDQ